METELTHDNLYKQKLKQKLKSINLPTLYGSFVAIFLFIISILCFIFISEPKKITYINKNVNGENHNHPGVFINFINDE